MDGGRSRHAGEQDQLARRESTNAHRSGWSKVPDHRKSRNTNARQPVSGQIHRHHSKRVVEPVCQLFPSGGVAYFSSSVACGERAGALLAVQVPFCGKGAVLDGNSGAGFDVPDAAVSKLMQAGYKGRYVLAFQVHRLAVHLQE